MSKKKLIIAVISLIAVFALSFLLIQLKPHKEVTEGATLNSVNANPGFGSY